MSTTTCSRRPTTPTGTTNPTRTTPTPTTNPTPTTPTPSALGRCVDPVPVEDFLAGHWEREPLVVARGEAGRFDDLLSVAALEQLLSSGGLRYPAFRLVREGGQIPLSSYATDIPWRPSKLTGTADPGRVAAAFADGATIVLQALHHTRPQLARFCRSLEAELGHPAQANAYFTPGKAQGFGVHHDTHDVFVLQVSGEKRWLVYEPVLELPLKEQRYSPRLGLPGAPVLDFLLRPGDTLYLPRGSLHEARASAADSLHLTVGVNVYTRLDALRAAVESLADDVEVRRSAPADGALPAALLERLAARLEPEQVRRRRRERFVASRRPILEGQLSELRGLDSLGPDTPVERRETVIADLDGTALVFEGKRVAFPPQAQAALEAVFAATGSFRPAELPGLDAESRLVLVRRLVREGFLRRSVAGA